MIRVLVLSGSVLLLGCAIPEVAPWDRDLLARQEMVISPDVAESAMAAHIYFSKEASSGGSRLGGGGCGCN